MNQYKNLFESIEINGLTLENRLVMTPMGTNFGEQNGEMSFLHMDYYERRVQGGYELMIVENACVKYPEGSNGTTQLRIDADNYIPRLYKLCETIHQYGAKIAIQLNQQVPWKVVLVCNLFLQVIYQIKNAVLFQENYQLRKFIVSLMIMQPQLKELKQ